MVTDLYTEWATFGSYRFVSFFGKIEVDPERPEKNRRNTRETRASGGIQKLAEREGFEPPIPFQVCRFSRPEPSTTRPPLPLLSFTTVHGSRAVAYLNPFEFNFLQASIRARTRPTVSTTHASLREDGSKSYAGVTLPL